MTKLDENGKRELVDRLALSERRVNQLIETGVIVESGDGTFDVETNRRRYQAFKDEDREYVISELSAASERFVAGIRRLEAEPDMTKRRAIEKRDPVGPEIGKMDGAYRLGNAISEQGHRPLLAMFTGRNVGDMFNLYCQTLGLTFIGDDVKPNRHARRAAGRR